MIKTVFIVGPTGIGKTKYAINYALEHNGEIVSADSMQIYKYMDIGSAKPSKEERQLVHHYLVDEIDPKDSFNVCDYQKLALKYIKEIDSKGKLPIVCGGTGLYLNSLIYNMDFSAPEGNPSFRDELLKKFDNDPIKLYERLKELDQDAASQIHPNNIKRVLRAIERLENGEEKLKAFKDITEKNLEIDAEIFNLSMDRDLLYQRINDRVDMLYDQGLETEVKSLMDMGFTSDDVAMKGIGYKEIIDAIHSGHSAEEARDLIKQNTRHYAKRQMTWFRRYQDAIIIDLASE